MAKDTTGQIVVTWTQSGTKAKVAKDLGPYPNTLPELNVRKLETIEELDVGCNHPVANDIAERSEGYGCGWSDTTQLYPVTATDIAQLRAAVAAKTAIQPETAISLAGKGVWWECDEDGERKLMEDC